MKIIKSKYKDMNAYTIDIGNVEFKVLPDMGMKFASAIHKESGFQFLHQNPFGKKKYIRSEYDSDFAEAGECSGFDDMMPTIDPFYYDEKPWNGIVFPNHGEIWCQPYEIKKGNSYIEGKVTGLRMPYIFTKRISAINENTIRIDYSVENPTQYSMKYLWAGHCMLNAEVGSKFITPKECNTGICMFSNNERTGKYGDKFNYPINVDKNGVKHDMSVMRSGDLKQNEKYYFADKIKGDGFVGVTYPSKKLAWKMSFPTDEIPYLGILNNECGWDDMYNCILEPCTVPYDRPDLAELHGYSSVLESHSIKKWYVEIEVKNI